MTIATQVYLLREPGNTEQAIGAQQEQDASDRDKAEQEAAHGNRKRQSNRWVEIMNILRFEANTPIQVALKFEGGREVDGRYGPQILYTLADGRLMYLEPKAARRINELKI